MMLSQRDADTIVRKSEIPEGTGTRDRKLAAAPKSLRQVLIKESGTSDEVRICAALEIQRTWRGYRARCNIYQVIEPKISHTAVYSGSKHALQRLQDVTDNDTVAFENSLSPKIEREEALLHQESLMKMYEDYVKKMQEDGVDPSDILSFEDFCALYFQNLEQDKTERWEKVKTQGRQKTDPLQHPHQESLSVNHQGWTGASKHVSGQDILSSSKGKGVMPRKKLEGLKSDREAAISIQRAWRRHIDIQVYRYYRDLINFKTRGDPSLMLRCINPNEAKFLDPASGIHVRFRLAGERFPPNIYYKIFTHRPVVDMCANSPKDYTIPEAKKSVAIDTHNKIKQRPVPGQDDCRGWYQRCDNNGWRLVSDRLIHHIMSDPVTWETSQKKYEFHHDKLQRKQDVEKRRKQKKIDWMKKMYKEGMLKAKADDVETVKLIEGAAAGMVATVEAAGSEALEEWEVDELLDWTTSLNFDDYWTTWKDLATSSNSEKKISDRLRIFTNKLEPYEFTLSTGPSRFQSTRQSHNTPVSSGSCTKIHIPVNS